MKTVLFISINVKLFLSGAFRFVLESLVLKDLISSHVQFHSNITLSALLGGQFHSQHAGGNLTTFDIADANQGSTSHGDAVGLTTNLSLYNSIADESHTVSLSSMSSANEASNLNAAESNTVSSRNAPSTPPVSHVSVGTNTECDLFEFSIKVEKTDPTDTNQFGDSNIPNKVEESVEFEEKNGEYHSIKTKCENKKVINSKRKRGRPRKIKEERRGPKRPVGRPKKIKLTKSKDGIGQVEMSDNVTNEKSLKPKVKKKPSQFLKVKKGNEDERRIPHNYVEKEFIKFVKAPNQNDFFCPLCTGSPRFTEEWDYISHFKDNHLTSDEKGYEHKCIHCERTFTTLRQREKERHKWRRFFGGIYYHMINKHSMEWPDFMDVWKCTKCGLFCSPCKGNVEVHQARCGVSQDQIELEKTVCLHCGKKYVSVEPHMKRCSKRLRYELFFCF